MPVPSVAPQTLTGPFRGPAMMQMTVIQNQTPEPRKPQPRYPWADWLVITLTLASAWYGVCQLVQLMIEG
ncbi:MAG TPA: hypothetical protein VHX99_02820 [Rhizomicrobium sp.]|nr:hypothetical protein [Rhizomicrobium sp.]